MRITLVISFILAAFFVQAQQDSAPAERKWLVGGNGKLLLETSGNKAVRLTFEIDPQVAYFLNNAWAPGLRLPVYFTSDTYGFGTLPFIRYYILEKGKILPFLEFNGGYLWGFNYNTATNSYSYLERSWLIGGQAGVAIFLGSNVSLDLFLYYQGKDLKVDNDGVITRFAHQSTFGLGVGFVVYLK